MIKRKIIFAIHMLVTCAAFLGIVSPVRAVPLEDETAPDWTQANPLTQKTSAYAWAQCADQPQYFYIIGGAMATNEPVDNLQRFDVTTNTWVQLASLPEAVMGSAGVCYDGYIYVVGGYTGLVRTNHLYIYDIAGNSWSIGTSLSRNVWAAALGAWDGKLFLAGGTPVGSPFTPVSTVNIYGIASGTWSTGPNMPVAASGAGSVQMGRFLFVVGGFSGDLNANLNTTQRLDMATQEWVLGSSFGSRRAGMALPATQDRLYAIGGDANSLGTTNPTALVEYMDLSTWPNGVWTSIPDPLPSALAGNNGSFCSDAIAGGEIWSVGGYESGTIVTDTVQYRPAEDCFMLFYQVGLLPATSELEDYPGETVTHTLTVNNIGHLMDTYDVSVASIWVASYPGTVGPLQPGETAAIEIAVQVPPAAPPRSSDSALVTVTSQGDTGVSDQSTLLTTAKSEYDPSVAPPSHMIVSDAGQTITHTLRVTNNGRREDTISLDVSGNVWQVSLPVTETVLAAGAWADIDVGVVIPMSAAEGENDTAILTATSQGDPVQTDSATLITEVTQYGTLLAAPDSTKMGDPGSTVSYTLHLTNSGNVEDGFSLSYADNTWPVSLSVTHTVLAPGTGVDLGVQIEIPADAAGGDFDQVIITATSDGDSAKTADVTLTTTTSNVYQLEMEPTDLALIAPQGDTVTYTLWITNTGNTTDTVDLGYSGNEWSVVLPITQTLLVSGMGIELNVLVSLPLDALGGAMDVVTITAASQGEPAIHVTATLTTTALWHRRYLPLIIDS